MSSKEVKFRFVGYVRTIKNNREKEDKNKVSEIILFEQFAEALDGIEEFSHIFIIFHLHQLITKRLTLKVHPRGRSDLPLVGVLATRSPYRPNPIGLTLVELIERKRNIIKVKGLDAINGTPVLDIKPYFPLEVDLKVRTPEWLSKLRI